ncbi:hypothetical protein PG357_07765 [Riemerella anatipestifer]|nr:hypothetical protein [Riemerella anatipestifer]
MKVEFLIDNEKTGKTWDTQAIPRVGDLIFKDDVLTEKTANEFEKKKLSCLMRVSSVVWHYGEENKDKYIEINLENQ